MEGKQSGAMNLEKGILTIHHSVMVSPAGGQKEGKTPHRRVARRRAARENTALRFVVVLP